MTFPYSWQKKVFFIALIAALLGLISESIAFFDFNYARENFNFLINAKFSLATLNLGYFNNQYLAYHNFKTHLMAGYLNILFYILLLIGVVLFVVSKQKESRLIRFVFSIIFLCNIIFLLNIFASLLRYYDQIFKAEFSVLFFLIFGITRHVLWIYLSYWLLKKFAVSKTFDTYQREVTENTSVTEYPQATLWQRFFHVIMDIYICIFIFSEYSHLIMNPFFKEIELEWGERMLMWMLVVVFRLIYYPVYEFLLGATPAKFLSETRVMKIDGSKANSVTILGRTLTRMVPFEALSFFGGEGWHDRWSDTQVVQEKRTGVYGGHYFWLFPIFIVTGLLTWWGYEKYEDYKVYTYHKDQHEQKIISLESKLNKLSEKDFIEIEQVGTYMSYVMYLKVEEVKDDHIRCSEVRIENSYDYTLLGIEKYYTDYKKHFPRVEIKRSDLLKAFTREFDDYNKGNRKGADLLKDGKQYQIKEIVRLFGPVLNEKGGSIGGENIYLRFCNEGWPANLIKIVNIKGDIEWQTSLPSRIETVKSFNYPEFELSGAHYKSGTPYRFRMIVEDSLHQQQVYEVEGTDLEKTFKQIQ